MATSTVAKGHHNRAVFFALWSSQLLSLLGSDVATFALRVWTYQLTNSVKSFSLITFFSEAAACMASPLAGVVVDRYSRKTVLICSDAVTALSTLALCVLYSRDSLEPRHIYLCSVISSLMGSLQWPAFKATVSLLIPPEDLVRYGGLNQAAPALSMLLSPLAAGLMVERFGLEGAFILEFGTVIAALAVMAAAQLPSPSSCYRDAKDVANGEMGLLTEAADAFKFVWQRPGLLVLLALLANGHLTSGALRLLMTPLLLNMGGAATLGSVLSVSGVGALAGSAALAAWGGPKKQAHAVLICIALQGVVIALIGLVRTPVYVLGLAGAYMFLIPFNRACRDSIWQRKTPADMQGRVFGLQRLVAESSAPLAALVAGPLADDFCESWMKPDGMLGGTWVGHIVGVGTGRGAALLFVFLGLANVAASTLSAFPPHLRRIEEHLPDMLVAPAQGKKED
jgi:DHA3 family macrolide efflux protein-like MFS transporter